MAMEKTLHRVLSAPVLAIGFVLVSPFLLVLLGAVVIGWTTEWAMNAWKKEDGE